MQIAPTQAEHVASAERTLLYGSEHHLSLTLLLPACPLLLA